MREHYTSSVPTAGPQTNPHENHNNRHPKTKIANFNNTTSQRNQHSKTPGTQHHSAPASKQENRHPRPGRRGMQMSNIHRPDGNNLREQLSPSSPDEAFLANARDADPLGIRSRAGTKVYSPSAPSGGRVGSVVRGNSVVDGPERLLNDDDPPANANVVKPSDLSLSWSRVVQGYDPPPVLDLKFFPPDSVDGKVVTITPPSDVVEQIEPGASLTEKIRLKSGISEGAVLDLCTEVTIEYQWKLVRCSTYRKVGHSFCQPKRVYKATGRVLPNASDFPGHSTKIPSSPKEVVKANSATMTTSNSFEILSEEDDLSRLGKSATQLGLISEEEGLVGPELQDACGARLELASPGPSHYNASIEESGNNKDSSAPQLSQGCHDFSGCNVDVHNDLELPSLCVNDDNCLTLPPDNRICKEDLPMNSASIESFRVCQCSNEPEGGPPGRSTRSHKSKRPAVRSSSSKQLLMQVFMLLLIEELLSCVLLMLVPVEDQAELKGAFLLLIMEWLLDYFGALAVYWLPPDEVLLILGGWILMLLHPRCRWLPCGQYGVSDGARFRVATSFALGESPAE
ncbi:hypothetical protein Nepgr_024763 [Nepenthes gracilis]|uniref:Uncharacterized protein n=1 Tax=Nepenthes gracilis TaxID=150966 RepID=A0AAD3Y0D8_NEPGR|nr:hypothetical protein Nepgr_024763 [Nepenthes gracilis]